MANSSALHLARLLLCLATLSSHIIFRQVAINQTAGSSQDSEVENDKVTIFLAEISWTWWDKQIWSGLEISILNGQSRRCSILASGFSQKGQDEV